MTAMTIKASKLSNKPCPLFNASLRPACHIFLFLIKVDKLDIIKSMKNCHKIIKEYISMNLSFI